MKKIFAISLSLVLLISTLGLSVVVNYCPMKKDYSFTLQQHKSCCCNDSKKNDCCKYSKFSFSKIKDKYVASAFQLNVPHLDFIIQTITLYVASHHSAVKEIKLYTYLKPPKLSVSLSILYRSLLI